MALAEDLERIATVAQDADDPLAGILAAELLDGTRVYLCAFASGAWLALDDAARPLESRRLVHDAASLAALCEALEDLAGIEPPLPRLATHAYLDALGEGIGPARATAVESALPAVEELAAQVAERHKTPLD